MAAVAAVAVATFSIAAVGGALDVTQMLRLALARLRDACCCCWNCWCCEASAPIHRNFIS